MKGLECFTVWKQGMSRSFLPFEFESHVFAIPEQINVTDERGLLDGTLSDLDAVPRITFHGIERDIVSDGCRGHEPDVTKTRQAAAGIAVQHHERISRDRCVGLVLENLASVLLGAVPEALDGTLVLSVWELTRDVLEPGADGE